MKKFLLIYLVLFCVGVIAMWGSFLLSATLLHRTHTVTVGDVLRMEYRAPTPGREPDPGKAHRPGEPSPTPRILSVP